MYLTLPSNSSLKFFPNNKAGHFITKLPQTLTLGDDYEVGLAEIQFSNNYQNITNNNVWFEYEEPRYTDIIDGMQNKQGTRIECESKRVMIPNGLYETNGQFIKALNGLVKSEITDVIIGERKKSIKFKYNPYTKRMSLFKFYAKSKVRLSDALVEILGISQNSLEGAGLFEADRVMDLDQRVKGIFVYSDLVRSRPVGDAVVPLLRTLPPVDKSKETVHYLFEKPHYMPLARFQFDTVELLLTSDRGEPISFDNGHTIATLHFRRKRIL